MKFCALALVMVTTILGVSGCNKPSNDTLNSAPGRSPGPSVAATPDEFATARAIFKKNCSVCHGEDGKGGTRTVEGKKLKVPNFSEGHALHHPDEDFVKQITKGGDGMPKFGDKLRPEEINGLVRFIRHEFQGK
jgi:mono/diheme cytochrome c family protein